MLERLVQGTFEDGVIGVDKFEEDEQDEDDDETGDVVVGDEGDGPHLHEEAEEGEHEDGLDEEVGEFAGAEGVVGVLEEEEVHLEGVVEEDEQQLPQIVPAGRQRVQEGAQEEHEVENEEVDVRVAGQSVLPADVEVDEGQVEDH